MDYSNMAYSHCCVTCAQQLLPCYIDIHTPEQQQQLQPMRSMPLYLVPTQQPHTIMMYPAATTLRPTQPHSEQTVCQHQFSPIQYQPQLSAFHYVPPSPRINPPHALVFYPPSLIQSSDYQCGSYAPVDANLLLATQQPAAPNFVQQQTQSLMGAGGGRTVYTYAIQADRQTNASKMGVRGIGSDGGGGDGTIRAQWQRSDAIQMIDPNSLTKTVIPSTHTQRNTIKPEQHQQHQQPFSDMVSSVAIPVVSAMAYAPMVNITPKETENKQSNSDTATTTAPKYWSPGK